MTQSDEITIYGNIEMAYVIRSCESERDQINNIKGREK